MYRRLVSFSTGLLLTLVLSSNTEATPLNYQIHFTLLEGGPALSPSLVNFTFDPATELFADLRMGWNVTPTKAVGFPFVGCSACVFPHVDLFHNQGVNDWTSSQKQIFLTGLLDGGNWWAADPESRDAYFDLDGTDLIMLGGGWSTGARGSGTFTTTLVPESSTFVMGVAGIAGLFIICRRRAIHNQRQEIAALHLSLGSNSTSVFSITADLQRGHRAGSLSK